MTVAENLRRTAPELRVFDLPRRQELHLRAMLWKDIRNFNARLGPGRHFTGLDFRHFMEYSEALLGCKPTVGSRLLVVGGHGSSLGLYLASKGCEVHVLDVDPRVMEQEQFARDAGLAPLLIKKRLVVRKLDGRYTDYPSDFFDQVFALSTLDHTRDQADTELIQEMARVAKPGALLSLSLRYGSRYQLGQQGGVPFRIYNDTELEQRLLGQVDLVPLRKFYFADDTVGLGSLWYRFPLNLRQWVLGWIVYPVGQAVAVGDASGKANASRICLLLQKPAEVAESTGQG